MNIKSSDLAARYGISDRHVRRLIADHAGTLDGHYEKNSKGTWMDQYAADYLYGLLRNPIEILPAFEPDPADLKREIEQLKEDNRRLSIEWAQAEQRANKGAGAVALLEASECREKQLSEENKKLTAANALKEAHIQRLSADSEAAKGKIAQAEENAQKASQELLDARKQFEDEKHLLEQQIAGMKAASLWQRIKGWKE